MIGIMADSHDNLTKIKKAVEIFNEKKCSLVIHAGDFVAPFAAKELDKLNCPVKAVYGNCDGEKTGLNKAFATLGDIQEPPFIFEHEKLKILVLHAPSQLEEYIAQKKFDLIVYGHLHEPKAEKKEGVLIINPGETCGWLSGKGTIAIVNPDTLLWEFIEL